MDIIASRYLSIVYCRAVSRQNSAAPRTPQAIPYRALVKQLNGPLENNIKLLILKVSSL